MNLILAIGKTNFRRCTPEPYHNNSPGGPTADQIKKNIRKCNKVLLLDKALTCSKTLNVIITYDTPHMHIYKIINNKVIHGIDLVLHSKYDDEPLKW